jgi:predicted RNase H-like HicB family nuclease
MTDIARYPIRIFWSDEDGGFIAEANDLPGCSAFGATQAEALTELADAKIAWIEAARAAGNAIPAPSQPALHRMPIENDADQDNLMAKHQTLFETIRPLLAGHAQVQGSVLADLTALWLCGHFIVGDDAETERLYETLLQAQVKGIRAFSKVHRPAMLARLAQRP